MIARKHIDRAPLHSLESLSYADQVRYDKIKYSSEYRKPDPKSNTFRTSLLESATHKAQIPNEETNND